MTEEIYYPYSCWTCCFLSLSHSGRAWICSESNRNTFIPDGCGAWEPQVAQNDDMHYYCDQPFPKPEEMGVAMQIFRKMHEFIIDIRRESNDSM